MKASLLVLLVLLLAHLTASDAADAPVSNRQPNVIVIVTDDQGAADAGC
jgi:hypothetical protein